MSKLTENRTTTGADGAQNLGQGARTYQAIGSTSSGTGAANIAIEVSNDGANWLTLGTISLSLATTASSDGFVSEAPWSMVRANVTSISGTGATVTVVMGA